MPELSPGSDRVAAEYVAVGRQLKLHREASDIEVSDLWPRYRLIRINAALATADARTQASVDLAEIQHEINARVEPPR